MRKPALAFLLVLFPACFSGSETKGLSAGEPAYDGGKGPAAGTLTAGIWDDNLNFDHFYAYRAGVGAQVGLPDFTSEEQAEAHRRDGTRSARTALDVALVIDTTGSMSDEIDYLRAEFEALAARLGRVDQRWAVVAYRDVGDDYVVQVNSFQADPAATHRELTGLSAGGGGDTPEAPDQALRAAADLPWTADARTARVLFWVADAPHHVEKAAEMSAAIRSLRNRDVHVYPVAASGVDALAEYTMRSAAQLTLGRYLFLTDDSGVGNPHMEPTIPCYWVTRLSYAMERVLQSEVAGARVEIDPAQVIRAVGEPKDGVCTEEGGSTMLVF